MARKKTLSDFLRVGYYLGEVQTKSDAQLLCDYAEHGAEAAFAELVHRQPLTDQIHRLASELKSATNRVADLLSENSRLKSGGDKTELLKLRGEVGTMRQQMKKGKSPGDVYAQLMTTSSAMELARVQAQQTLKDRHAPLIQKLNLSPEDADKLFNLIVDTELKKKVMLSQLMSGDLDVTTALQQRDAAKAEMQTNIAALLGDAGYAQYDQFSHDIAAGALVDGLNRQLGTNALTGDQSQQLQALFGAKPDITMDDMDLFQPKESLDALFQTLVDRGHHDLQAASSFLTPEQLAAAYVIQSNYFNTIRASMTLGQQVVRNAAKPVNP